MIRKISILCLLVLVSVLSMATESGACTSFAVYSKQPLFAMNFDYPETDIKLNFFNQDGLKVFYGQFKEGEMFPMFLAASNKGMFIPTQIQYPSLPAQKELGPSEMYIGDLPSGALPFDHVSQVRELIQNKRLAPMPFPIHVLVADKYGDASIFEVGKEKNNLVDIDGKFIVMSNFKNSDFTGKPYTDVFGGGADRYKTAYEEIQKNVESFNVDNAWDVLKKTVQTNKASETLMSSVFDPTENVVYFCLKRNFDKVWKVSLENGTIETYKGFSDNYKVKIPQNGILSTVITDEKLMFEAQKAYNELNKTNKDQLLIVTGVIFFLVFPSVLLIRKKSVFKKK